MRLFVAPLPYDLFTHSLHLLYKFLRNLVFVNTVTHALVHDLSWKSSVAALGLCTGFIAAILGSIVTVISWFRDPVWHHVALHQAGTTLFVLTLPLLLLGAHCLDLIDKDKAEKIRLKQ